jgi:hypothetical protein
MSLVAEYKITRTTGTCGLCPGGAAEGGDSKGCGKAFAEGEEFTTALFANGETFERRDFCAACWKESPDAYSYWRSRAPRKDEKKRENPMAVWAFFESLAGDADPQRKKLAFLLSLTLQRKRILKMAGTRRDGAREFLELEKRPDGTRYSVEVPDIKDEEMAALREELVRLLDSAV